MYYTKEHLITVRNTYFSEPDQNNRRDIYKENLRFLEKRTFIVCSMFTPNNPYYFSCADRLARSCETYELPYCIYKVANIHKSTSTKGIDDPAFTKAKFIFFNMHRFPAKDIFYMDGDTFFVDYPNDVIQASNAGYDFAIYNWLNDRHNEAYMPINGKIEPGNRLSDFYSFSHAIDVFCPEQLICSGSVQFYKNSEAAKKLLEHWQNLVTRYPDFADDEGLDYVYNNCILHSVDLKAYWLDKSYLRFPWWPHIKPVILHPEFPSTGRTCHITEIENRRRYYLEKCNRNSGDLLFPRDWIIDTKERVLLRVVNNQVVGQRPIQQDFWIYPEKVGL